MADHDEYTGLSSHEPPSRQENALMYGCVAFIIFMIAMLTFNTLVDSKKVNRVEIGSKK